MAIEGYQTLIRDVSETSPPAAILSPQDPMPAEIRRLEAVLSALGFNHSSTPLLLYSLATFVVVGVAVPATVAWISKCEGNCEVYRVVEFEVNAIISQILLSGFALAFVSRSMRKLGVRGLVCFDRGTRDLEKFRKEYAEKIVVWIW